MYRAPQITPELLLIEASMQRQFAESSGDADAAEHETAVDDAMPHELPMSAGLRNLLRLMRRRA